MIWSISTDSRRAVAAVLGGLTALWGWFGWLVLAWLLCMALDYGTGHRRRPPGRGVVVQGGKGRPVAQAGGRGGRPGGRYSGRGDRFVLANIPALEMPFQYEVFVSVLVLVWYIMTELGSIVENIGALGAPCPHGSARPSPRWSPPWTAPGTSWETDRTTKSKSPNDWKYEWPPGPAGLGGAVLICWYDQIIGKEFSVCTAQAELVVNPSLGLRGELAPYMFPTVTDQEEIRLPNSLLWK